MLSLFTFLNLGDMTFVYYLRCCHCTAVELQAKIEEVRTERQLSIDRVNILEQENGRSHGATEDIGASILGEHVGCCPHDTLDAGRQQQLRGLA